MSFFHLDEDALYLSHTLVHSPISLLTNRFARFYPLSQADPDLPTELGHVDFGPLVPRGATVEHRSRDYTPPQYISLLITNLGVLTPAAVSDELIKLYNGEREVLDSRGHHGHAAHHKPSGQLLDVPV